MSTDEIRQATSNVVSFPQKSAQSLSQSKPEDQSPLLRDLLKKVLESVDHPRTSPLQGGTKTLRAGTLTWLPEVLISDIRKVLQQ